MLARDSVPVVMHDPHLGRTVSGIGNVFDYDAAELVTMDAGSWFGREHADVTVPLLTEYVDFCKGHGLWMNIELKPAPGFEEPTGRIVARLVRAMFCPEIGADDPRWIPLLSSFSVVALQAARAAAPDLPRALLLDRIDGDWDATARRLQAVAIHTNHRHLTPAQAAAIKAGGYALFCYTVNDPLRARELLDWGVEGFCTDRIDLIPADFAAKAR